MRIRGRGVAARRSRTGVQRPGAPRANRWRSSRWPASPLVDDDTVDELAITTLAAGLGIDLAAARDPFEVLIERIAQHDLLLVVDNLEHLAGAGAVLGRVLASASSCSVRW